MAETHVVSGLLAKRSEMAGLIEHHRKEMARLTDSINHISATIKLFAPQFDLRTARIKAHRTRNQFFRLGECQRLVLEIFRDANGASLSSRHIAEALLERKGLDAELLIQMQKNALSVVHRLVKTGVIQACDGDGRGQLWRLI